MTLTLDIADNSISLGEVRALVSLALEKDLSQAIARRDAYRAECRHFELAHGVSIAAFLEGFESGALGDEAYLFDWFAAKQALDRWERRVEVLSGVTVAGT
jgi:hypothetical protein